jgi:lipoyl(octanoyl) transferase
MIAQLWQDNAERGSWNMALDWAMLRQASSESSVILRVYSWSEPTVSLGYFQNLELLNDFPTLRSLACVRRVTGGGAILHDREWTYSIAIPESTPRKGHSDELYRSVHRSIEEWLNQLGFPAKSWESTQNPIENSEQAFMCFERRSPVDLVVAGDKVLGSAQRRTEFGLLQHGSLLNKPSLQYPSLKGLSGFRESCERVCDDDRMTSESVGSAYLANLGDVRHEAFIAALKSGLDEIFQLDWTVAGPSLTCYDEAKRIEESKFANPDWTRTKSR